MWVQKNVLPLQPQSREMLLRNKKSCGNSSVGRAQPCQGWGRGSESRFPLKFFIIFPQKDIIFPMNLYLRYFDKETLVHNVDDAIDFLRSIPEIGMNVNIENDIRDYVASDVFYPKRYKVRQRVYFIIIKTTAATMLDFKQKKALHTMPQQNAPVMDKRDLTTNVLTRLNEERPGWYEGALDFKRVVMIPATGKHEYRDTHFVVQCKAMSGIDCYNRIVDHLRGRVDTRSQFPSAKGKNFHFKYLGMWK